MLVALPEKITPYMVLLGHILIEQEFNFSGLDKITKHNPITREDQPLYGPTRTYLQHWFNFMLLDVSLNKRSTFIYGPTRTYINTRD